ncbi:hypothetical protein AM593_00021, partial [Mytilus galloprovincialis]
MEASKFSKSRLYCDNLFLQDMLNVCNRMSFLKKAGCKYFARIMNKIKNRKRENVKKTATQPKSKKDPNVTNWSLTKPAKSAPKGVCKRFRIKQKPEILRRSIFERYEENFHGVVILFSIDEFDCPLDY